MTTPSLRSRRQPGIRFFLTLAACLSAVLLVLPLSAQAAFPGGNGKIAFDRPDNGIFGPSVTISSIHPRGGKVSF